MEEGLPDLITAFLSPYQDKFTVVERDGMIIACVALYPFLKDKVAELACVAVHPDYQGKNRETLNTSLNNSVKQ